MATFFSQLEPKFPTVSEKHVIKIDPLLKAAKQLVPFFDLLGSAFKVVKNDIEGNIVKLQKKYNEQPERYASLYAMLNDEVKLRTTTQRDSACTSMLWLNRALQFILIFLQQIVEDHVQGKKTENMVPFCKLAYDETLKPYHSWIVRKIFAVISIATPWRRNFLKTVALGKEGVEVEKKVMADISEFVLVLSQNVDQIKSMYEELAIDCEYKV